MKKNVKQLLGIDLEAQLSRADFLEYIDHRDDVVKREIFVFTLREEFGDFFDKLRFICFDGKLNHLSYSGSSKKNLVPLDEIVKKIYHSYGPDENGYGADGIRGQNFLSWFFKNEQHEIATTASSTNEAALYYGLLFSRIRKEIEFTILKYANLLDTVLTSQQLKHRVGIKE